MIELIFLGTSSMVPTKERNQSALFISYGTEGILVDCGEGTQRQLKMANISLTKISRILITHWHGDHVLGLPGLLQSLAASNYTRTLKIYGPNGTKKHFSHMFEAFVFDRAIELDIIEIKEGTFFENNDLSLSAVSLNHGIITFGYIFQEKDKRKILISKVQKLGIPEGPLLGQLQQGKPISWKGKEVRPEETTKIVPGKRIGIISDTLPCNACMIIAKNADLLISEATYSSKFEGKSECYNHMTSKQAALIASNSGAKRLILTHFSARYKSTLELNEESHIIFPNTECAYDLMRVRL